MQEKLDNKEISIDTYTVEFRITGSFLRASEITELLALSPSQTTFANSNENIWSYDGVSTENNFVEQEWKSLEEGLIFILDKLLPKKDLIESNLKESKKYLWCGCFQETLAGGLTFSPRLLNKLSEFNTELIIRNYCS
ncbi:MAG TPA: DUF4279 domain-containing protein [Sulfurovum sp.]|nr:DUF4279 domain-containing protein [Sulfurovum sp.]